MPNTRLAAIRASPPSGFTLPPPSNSTAFSSPGGVSGKAEGSEKQLRAAVWHETFFIPRDGRLLTCWDLAAW